MEDIKTTYVVVRIDYINHTKQVSDEEDKSYVADIMIDDALSHKQTIESGIEIINIENCGINE